MFDLENLDQHYKMNFVVIDNTEAVVDESRDLDMLQIKHAQSARLSFSDLTDTLFNEVYSDDFPDDIPKQLLMKQHSLVAFPYFSDTKKGYQIKLDNNELTAIDKHKEGTLHFIRSKITKEINQLRKNLPKYNELALQYQVIGDGANLLDDISNAIILNTGLANELPYKNTDMQQAIDQTRSEYFAQARIISSSLLSIVSHYKNIKLSLDDSKPYYEDISNQLAQLVYPGFIAETQTQRLGDLDRYLAAINIRLEKASHDLSRDQRWQQQVTPYVNILNELTNAESSPKNLLPLVYLIEEYRVSLFAQNEIKTAGKVSPKRLENLIEDIRQQY